MDIITVDKSEVRGLVKEGGKLVFKQSAELQIVKLLDLIDFLNDQVTEVKKMIECAGLDSDPNFKGVIGQKVKALFRSYGERYEIVDRWKINPKFIKEVTKISVDADKVNEHVGKYGKLPDGIRERERKEQISLSRIEK